MLLASQGVHSFFLSRSLFGKAHIHVHRSGCDSSLREIPQAERVRAAGLLYCLCLYSKVSASR